MNKDDLHPALIILTRNYTPLREMENLFSSLKKFLNNANLGRIIKDKVSETEADYDDFVEEPSNTKKPKPSIIVSLVAGAAAGVVVDISLFPLDTLKTRLQSQQGFIASGGFKGVYKGLAVVMLGSAPTSAIFFGSYNSSINYLKREHYELPDSFVHFVAASLSEIVSALVKFPLEMIKQRKQTALPGVTNIDILKKTVSSEGIPGLYRGLLSLLVREIPFAAIQFPLWEYFKLCISMRYQRPVTAFETACCGAAAGGISAAVTTPMDVLKTRTVLAEKDVVVKYGRLLTLYLARDVYIEKGLSGLFAGIVPRVLWITLGGFIYFGMYEYGKQFCEKYFLPPDKEEVSVEGPCSNEKELKEREMKKALVSQLSPAYTDPEELDDKDFNGDYELYESEMDYGESLEFASKLVELNN